MGGGKSGEEEMVVEGEVRYGRISKSGKVGEGGENLGGGEMKVVLLDSGVEMIGILWQVVDGGGHRGFLNGGRIGVF